MCGNKEKWGEKKARLTAMVERDGGRMPDGLEVVQGYTDMFKEFGMDFSEIKTMVAIAANFTLLRMAQHDKEAEAASQFKSAQTAQNDHGKSALDAQRDHGTADNFDVAGTYTRRMEDSGIGQQSTQ